MADSTPPTNPANTLSLQESRSKLAAHFAPLPPSTHGAGWSRLWDAGDFLPFDRGCPNPAFEDTLTQKTDILGAPTISSQPIKRKRALVPGCGRGYDVLLLASFGYDAYGLEISETAVQRGRDYAEEVDKEGRYPVRNEGVGRGKVVFVQGDFFDGKSWSDGEARVGTWDLIYDYTFLSALPPVMRPAWAKRMCDLLSPTGHLVCVEFPTYKDPKSGGPPWGLPPEVYVAHLAHPGETIPYDEAGKVKSESAASGQDGLVRVAHWQPERTHEVGKGTDWVSIWRHA